MPLRSPRTILMKSSKARGCAMTESQLDRGIIFVLRIMIGWTFLYAGIWQIKDNYDISGFLNHVVAFHDFFANFAAHHQLSGEMGSFADRLVLRLRSAGARQRAV